MDTEACPPGGAGGRRVPLVLVAGLEESAVATTAVALQGLDDTGTALVHHDLRDVAGGVVRRRVRQAGADHAVALELAHGCVSCTLREDLLPLLRRLCEEPHVTRIVLQLDPALEPEALSWAIQHVLIDDRPLIEDVEPSAVVTVVDMARWLADAGGDEALLERGLSAGAEDERTVAQLAVGQVEFADALVLTGAAEDPWQQGRTEAVLARLAPTAPSSAIETLGVAGLLERIPATARRGTVDGAHGPLLRGQPRLSPDSGVSVVLFEQRRPFHPERLHDAFDTLLEGTVRVRGRVWVASQPDTVLWLESAGGGLSIGHAGPWLASLTDEQWEHADAEHQVRASLNWDECYGDRAQDIVLLAHEAAPHELIHALDAALLSDEEVAAGRQVWASYPDPFGDWHTDPCLDAEDTGREAETGHQRGQG